MTTAYQKLSARMQKINDLGHLQAMSHWDEAVMMPPGGGEARAQALSTLSSVLHDFITAPEIAEEIASAKTETLTAPWEQMNLEIIEKNYRRAVDVPSDLVAKFTRAHMQSEQAWREMRATNDWQAFLPLFSETFKLCREIATIQGESLGMDPYDALIDQYSTGFNQAIIDPIFSQLKAELPNIIKNIVAKQADENLLPITGTFLVEQQRQLGLELMQALGFNFNHGRLDVSHHPFCGGVPSDVRITTRYSDHEFITSAMGICHETGHARYEQGLPTAWSGQPVGKALGMAIHESQSLLIEMYACRSAAFMEFLSPLVKRHFGDNPCYNPANLLKIYTRVKPGYIRVDADAVTYPLHVILRYELEQQLFTDQLSIKDLPEAWDQKMRTYLDLSTGANYQNGVMQDVHWPAGIFGYFPAYTLGSLIAAQLFAAATKAHPQIENQLKQGDFTTLFSWLNKHVHSRASSVSPTTLIQDATGGPLDSSYYLKHISERYRE